MRRLLFLVYKVRMQCPSQPQPSLMAQERLDSFSSPLPDPANPCSHGQSPSGYQELLTIVKELLLLKSFLGEALPLVHQSVMAVKGSVEGLVAALNEDYSSDEDLPDASEASSTKRHRV